MVMSALLEGHIASPVDLGYRRQHDGYVMGCRARKEENESLRGHECVCQGVHGTM
jgi:hypothetical protein